MESRLMEGTEKVRRARRRASAAMGLAIAVAVAIGAFLLWRGWGERAVSVAAGVLLLCYLAVCLWAGLMEERASGRLAEGLREPARAHAGRGRGPEDRRGDRAGSEQHA